MLKEPTKDTETDIILIINKPSELTTAVAAATALLLAVFVRRWRGRADTLGTGSAWLRRTLMASSRHSSRTVPSLPVAGAVDSYTGREIINSTLHTGMNPVK